MFKISMKTDKCLIFKKNLKHLFLKTSFLRRGFRVVESIHDLWGTCQNHLWVPIRFIWEMPIRFICGCTYQIHLWGIIRCIWGYLSDSFRGTYQINLRDIYQIHLFGGTCQIHLWGTYQIHLGVPTRFICFFKKHS